jgi:hypothetical protein
MIKLNVVKIWISLQLLGSVVMAQSERPPLERGVNAHASIVGALKYPGIKVGVDYQVIQKQVEKTKRKGTVKNFYKNGYITSNLGFYYHKGYNTNFFLQGGYQWQRVRSNGWFTVIEPQLGVSRTFIDGTVYKVSNDGNVTRKRGAGHFYLAPSLSFGFGKDLSLKKGNIPLTLFSKVTLFTNLPYNNFIYVRAMAEVGASYHITNFMPHTVKTKYKKK